MSRASLLLLVLLSLVPAAVAQSGTVFLVRHAEKASSAADAELSEIGRKRAECLARTLRDSGIKSIDVTEVKRTQQTAEPLAKQAGITVTVTPARDTQATKQKAVEQLKTGNVLIVGHSNTIPEIRAKLTNGSPAPRDAAMLSMADDDYDKLFIVTFADGRTSTTMVHYCIAQP
jgi:broad specificity phosphatase PhoE